MTIQTDGINKDSYGNKEVQEGRLIYAADTAATDTYLVALQPAATEYVTGMTINFLATTANTAGATLNVNGLGAKNILKNHDVALATGDIEAAQLVTVIYDGTSFQMQSQSGQAVELTDFGANVATFLATPSSANLATAVTDETGSGLLVFATSPTLTTPALGTPSGGALDNCTSDTAADNDSSTQLATTAFAKSQDAVLRREPDQAVAMTAATSGSTGITVADTAQLDNGTGAFTLSCKRALASWTVAAILMEKHDDTTGYRLSTVVTTGYIKLEINDKTYTSTAAPGFVAGTAHRITATVSPGAVNTTVAFYADGVAFGAPADQANETTTDNAVAFYAMGTDAVRTAGIDGGDIVYNRALTAAEVLDLYRNGVAESDKWGSQTSLVTGDNVTFASDTGWWTRGNATVTIVDGVCHFIDATDYQQLFKAAPFHTIGKRYRLIFTVKNYSTGNIAPYWGDYGTTRTGNGTYTEEYTATAEALNFQSLSADTTLDLDDVYVYEIGATLALEPEGIQTDKWYDSSSNNLAASYPTVGWTLTRQPGKKRIKQPTPTAETTTATLTIAELLTGIITATHTAGATQAYTLTTGALADAWPAFGINDYFDWVLINLSAAAADTVTVTAAEGHTIVGNPIVQSAHATTGGIMGNSATFRTRKTASSTFITYRIN